MTTEHPTPATAREQKPGKAGLWATLIAFLIIFFALLIFIAQNSTQVNVHYLGTHVDLGFGIAMVIAAITGAVLTAIVGLMRSLRRTR